MLEGIDEHAGEALVIGSLVDPGGVPRAKAVPRGRAHAFATVGVGASPSWNVFCADDLLAFTDRFSVVGDVRLRIEPSTVRDLGGGLAWAPMTVWTQDGVIAASCTRTALTRTVEKLAACGLTAAVGHELEFVLFSVDERTDAVRIADAPSVGESPEWSAYGLGSAIRHADFLQGVLRRARTAGLDILQLHAEWAPRQFEISLAARPPVEASDDLLLARTIVGLAAREAGFAASFSPVPVAGGASNGAHQHLSLAGEEGPLLSGGGGPYGMTDAGAAAVAGILVALPDLGAVLSGSPLSSARLQPGMWAGARVCWGLENREAAVRLIAAAEGDPDGAHVEVKPIDSSANPYLATSLLLEAALTGIEQGSVLPDAVDVDPEKLADPPALMPTTDEQLERFGTSAVVASALGAELVEAVTAVRRLEQATWGMRPMEERARRFRFTWGG